MTTRPHIDGFAGHLSCSDEEGDDSCALGLEDAPHNRHNLQLHCTVKKTEFMRGRVTAPRSQSHEGQNRDQGPRTQAQHL